jgi:hypothetical protein
MLDLEYHHIRTAGYAAEFEFVLAVLSAAQCVEIYFYGGEEG